MRLLRSIPLSVVSRKNATILKTSRFLKLINDAMEPINFAIRLTGFVTIKAEALQVVFLRPQSVAYLWEIDIGGRTNIGGQSPESCASSENVTQIFRTQCVDGEIKTGERR